MPQTLVAVDPQAPSTGNPGPRDKVSPVVSSKAIRSLEVLSFVQSPRADATLAAIAQQALRSKIRVTATRTFRGGADLLLLWGPGAPDRVAPMRRQLAAGGHVAVCDLAYWHRDRKIRISLDAAHPSAWVLKHDWPTTRVQADAIRLTTDWDPTGPVLVAGIGDKAKVQYGAAVVAAWETAIMAECRLRGRTVVYRPKQGSPVPIAQALQGCGLVVTWHSNVAVDAIRQGIPVVCREGAAAAVCGSELPADVMPPPLPMPVRDRFLANLAWFQWDLPSERAACWTWLTQVLA